LAPLQRQPLAHQVATATSTKGYFDKLCFNRFFVHTMTRFTTGVHFKSHYYARCRSQHHLSFQNLLHSAFGSEFS
jgi:glutaredoxin 2